MFVLIYQRLEKIDWNDHSGTGDYDDEFLGDEGDEEIGLSTTQKKQVVKGTSSDDQDYDGEDESDQSEK